MVAVHPGMEHNKGGAAEIPDLIKVATAALINELSPPQITANTNDYAPNGHFDNNVWRLSTDAQRNLTGMLGGVPDRVVALCNIGTNNLLLKHNVTSQTYNRFSLPDATDQVILPGCAAVVRYDSVSARWRLLSYVYDMAAVTAAAGSLLARVVVLEGQEPLTVHRSSDLDLTATTTTLTNVFSVALAASSYYRIEVFILYNSGVTPDFQYQLNGPTGATGSLQDEKLFGATRTTSTIALGANSNADGTAAAETATYEGYVLTTNAGNLTLQAAQQTGDAASTKVLKGSYMIATPLP